MRKLIVILALLLTLGGLAVGAYYTLDRIKTAAGRAHRANDIRQIGRAYLKYFDEKKKWPTELEDLQPYLAESQVYQKLRDGQYIVVWDACTKEKAKEAAGIILVYDKDAAVKGGPVCHWDLELRNLTAEEFQTALKAQSK